MKHYRLSRKIYKHNLCGHKKQHKQHCRRRYDWVFFKVLVKKLLRYGDLEGSRGGRKLLFKKETIQKDLTFSFSPGESDGRSLKIRKKIFHTDNLWAIKINNVVAFTALVRLRLVLPRMWGIKSALYSLLLYLWTLFAVKIFHKLIIVQRSLCERARSGESVTNMKALSWSYNYEFTESTIYAVAVMNRAHDFALSMQINQPPTDYVSVNRGPLVINGRWQELKRKMINFIEREYFPL